MSQKYIIYTRCSTEEQKKKGYSHDYQIAGIRANQRPQGEELAVYSDTHTGTTFKRPELDRLHRLCKSKRGIIDMIWIYRWDRFGRNTEEALKTIRLFQEIGVEVNCVDNYIDYNDPNWPVLLSVTLSIAHSESLKISDRTRDGQYQALIKGNYIYKLPKGYKRIKGKIVCDEELKDIIVYLFEQASVGANMAALFREYGKVLQVSETQFYHLLKNEIYTGFYTVPAYKQFKEVRVRGNIEPIISVDLFKQVQIMKRKSASYRCKDVDKSEFFLKGLLYCDLSNKKMTGYMSKGKTKYYPYYQTPRVKGNICNADRVHEAFRLVLSKLKFEFTPDQRDMISEVYDAECKKDTEQLETLNNHLNKLNKQLEKIENDYFDGHIDGRTYNMLTRKVKQGIINTENELNNSIQRVGLGDNGRLFEHLENLEGLFLKANDYGKHELARAIFPSGIWINKKDYVVRTPELNIFIESNLHDTGVSEVLLTKNGTKYVPNVVVGGNPSRIRTHLFLLNAISA